MLINYLRRVSGRERTDAANRHLARYLAFVAGAANAGAFLAVGQYTSHMSGLVSAMADHLALGELPLILSGLAAIFAFMAGSATTALLLGWTRAHDSASAYALPLLVEAALLVAFGWTAGIFEGRRVLGSILLLCYAMGLQNAILTRVSDAVIRTTHLTGMITDLGIKLGRMVYAAFHHEPLTTVVEMSKLQLLSSLIALFFIGGVIGAFSFRHLGFLFTLPLAAILLVLASVPLADDVIAWLAVDRS
jgi:uncharacterized membrane protein YoaK (UPF0700 family)